MKPAPVMHASMYFAYGNEKRPEVRSKTTFDAILAGERTSTTRFPQWPGYQRWIAIRTGDIVRFYADKQMLGRHVDVEILAASFINLAECSAEDLEAWSLAEGWAPEYGRSIGHRHGLGLWINYRRLEQTSVTA